MNNKFFSFAYDEDEKDKQKRRILKIFAFLLVSVILFIASLTIAENRLIFFVGSAFFFVLTFIVLKKLISGYISVIEGRKEKIDFKHPQKIYYGGD